MDFLKKKKKEEKEKKEKEEGKEGGGEEGGEGEGERRLLKSFEVVQECLQVLYRKIIGKLEGEEREGGRAGRVQEVFFFFKKKRRGRGKEREDSFFLFLFFNLNNVKYRKEQNN